jgi:glycine dehydrogenase
METLMTTSTSTDHFVDRHLGSGPAKIEEMLDSLGLDSLESLEIAVIPEEIRHRRPLDFEAERSERRLLAELREIAGRNETFRSYIGLGYHDTFMPPVILRNVLENPAWYTQYTPYQPEIAQGRLEALMNFQTMISGLTALPVANASLLDEATAAAEAMSMCWAAGRQKKSRFLVDPSCHPQTRAVLETRARPLGISVEVQPLEDVGVDDKDVFGLISQYPATDGAIPDIAALATTAKAIDARLVIAADPLALALLEPPGELGADIAVGSTQRFGLPMAAGGPHAAYLACGHDLERKIPGRIVGVSRDAQGDPAFRLALQTREQHIRREKATSNICTAQVLPAILASMYAVYHGPSGLTRIARRVHRFAAALAAGLDRVGITPTHDTFFDTLRLDVEQSLADAIHAEAASHRVNLRRIDSGALGISLDETVDERDLDLLLDIVATATGSSPAPAAADLLAAVEDLVPTKHLRESSFLDEAVFNRFHTEHEMLRYLYSLQQKDLSLATSMIPLGSCTMKLNATSEMIPITWPEFGQIHPFAPSEQQRGFRKIYSDLGTWLTEITGMAGISFQPNAGSQGEYAGLLVIRTYHAARGQADRDVCLIPTSAHGTNPASAVMAGLRVVPVACSESGDIDIADLRKRIDEHRDRLAALMITYPSTHGVFERRVVEICEAVHDAGGQVYLDGANLNAQVGLCRPGDYGADVCHLNLHKTFCIPHGGGGPGMGPICVAEHLVPHLPGHPLAGDDSPRQLGAVAAAPFGSPGILPISWMYIALMGNAGLVRASRVAILNANYMARRLAPHYPILYTGHNGFVAHEFIVDLRQFKASADITVDDVAKRLMDYGFHAPTMSWPVAGTMMIEPTESESKEELDRFCDAMISIREEIRAIESGASDRSDNPLHNAPHTVTAVTATEWSHPYTREAAAFPAPWVRERKFWPAVGRIDNAYGDRHLVCTCDTVEAYAALQPSGLARPSHQRS